MADSATGPLDGLKLLDMTRFGAGPSCTMVLADMGADTVKLEPFGEGDPNRLFPPLIQDIGGYFPCFNRNKRSITLDLRKSKGKDIFRRLAQWADVIVENFRPGTLARLGFPFETLHQLNPRVILVSISGFGQTGPYAQRAAFDTVSQAISGVMDATGRSVGRPIPAGAIIADMTGGLFGIIGALLALEHRHKTGRGQWVDVSMMEGQLFHMNLSVLTYARQTPEQRAAPPRATGGMTFQMKDGAWMVIMYQDDNHWPRLARIMGRSDLADSPDYATRAKRAPLSESLHSLVQQWAGTVTTAEAEAVLEKEGLPYARVMTIADLLKDPHVKARHAIEWVRHSSGETLPLVGVVPKLSDSPGSIRFPAPHLGEHNEEVYCGILGFSKEELDSLKTEKVI